MRKTLLKSLLILAAAIAFISLGGCYYHTATVHTRDFDHHHSDCTPPHWSYHHGHGHSGRW